MNTIHHDADTGGTTGLPEFVALMAFTMSLVALSIDAMLPAFPDMSRDLGVTGANDIQLVVSTLFIGLATGQLFYGPLSDSIGRKPAIYTGFVLFILGSMLSMMASDFTLMLAGRLLQGIGAAGPRTGHDGLSRLSHIECVHCMAAAGGVPGAAGYGVWGGACPGLQTFTVRVLLRLGRVFARRGWAGCVWMGARAMLSVPGHHKLIARMLLRCAMLVWGWG